MELDEMKQAWQVLGRQLERHDALALQLLREGRLDKLRRGLRRLGWGQALQLAVGVALMFWGIGFWATHAAIWQAVACGLAMQAIGTLTCAFSVRLLVMQQGIDYAAPVLAIQRRLARMRVWRVQVEAPAFAVLGGVAWIVALLMLAQYAGDRLGLNPWQHLRPGFVSWPVLTALVSVGVVLLAWFVVRRLGHGRWLDDRLAGSAIRHAEDALAEIANFEREV